MTKKIRMIQQIVRKKGKKKIFTWTWLATDYIVTQHPGCAVVHYKAARSPRPHSPTTYTLWLHATPQTWPVCGWGAWWHWSFCRGLLNEQHFHLTCLWVYFIRWLSSIGAFWLYSAHLGSLWAGWHVSTWRSSHIKPSTLLWLQKLHPGTCFFTRLFFVDLLLSLLKTMAFSSG